MVVLQVLGWWLVLVIFASFEQETAGRIQVEFAGNAAAVSPGMNDPLSSSSSSSSSSAASAASGTAASSRGNGHGGSKSSGGGVNVLAAMLVTASSMMVFMAFRLWICGCSRRSSSGGDEENGSNADQMSSVEEMSLEQVEGILNSNSNNSRSGNLNSSTSTSNSSRSIDEVKKKRTGNFGVDSIDKFTVLVDYGKDVDRSLIRCCSVCLCEFIPGNEVRVLPSCSHFFHPDCIDRWLVSQMSCPDCRGSVIPSKNAGEIGV